jgi:tRNA(fMet)-specific endonuclease VapC
MKYVLDTSICVGILRGKSPKARLRLDWIARGECGMSSVVLFELQAGALKSNSPTEEMLKVAELARPFASLRFDDECARMAAEIRRDLERKGIPIGPFDLLIAATARYHGLILVTRNVGEFRRVPDLVVEDWEAA